MQGSPGTLCHHAGTHTGSHSDLCFTWRHRSARLQGGTGQGNSSMPEHVLSCASMWSTGRYGTQYKSQRGGTGCQEFPGSCTTSHLFARTCTDPFHTEAQVSAGPSKEAQGN